MSIFLTRGTLQKLNRKLTRCLSSVLKMALRLSDTMTHAHAKSWCRATSHFPNPLHLNRPRQCPSLFHPLLLSQAMNSKLRGRNSIPICRHLKILNRLQPHPLSNQPHPPSSHLVSSARSSDQIIGCCTTLDTNLATAGKRPPLPRLQISFEKLCWMSIQWTRNIRTQSLRPMCLLSGQIGKRL